MKKFLKTLFSLIFAIALTTPTSGFAAPVQELDETAEERTSHSVYSGHYTLTFLKADFGLSLDRSELEDQAGSLIVFITNPEGKIVKDAQVVTTIIGRDGSQIMKRARSSKGGYVIDTAFLDTGPYRLEAEIITNGWLLTDEIRFRHV